MKIWKLSSDVQNYDAVKPVDGYNHSLFSHLTVLQKPTHADYDRSFVMQ